MSGERILVAHGDPVILERIRRALDEAPEGYALEITGESRQVLTMARSFAPHAFVLARSFRQPPTAHAVCRKLRRSQQHRDAGVLVVAQRLKPGEEHRVTLHGADLCLRLPPLNAELIRENVRGLLDHVHKRQGAMTRVGTLLLCPDRRRAWIGRRQLRLTPMQFDILHRLALRADDVLSHQELLGYGDAVPPESAERVIRVQIHRIRQEFDRERHLIQTVRGLGYRLRRPA